MRYVERPAVLERFRRSTDGDERLRVYLRREIEDALASMHEYEQAIQEALRQYYGVPKRPVRSLPVENAPNIEITLGAIAVDALYAQAISTIFNTSPIVTVRETHAAWTEHAKGLQTFVNWGVENEWMLRQAAEHSILDCIQFGTGGYYVPYEEGIRKTAVRRIIERGPKIRTIAPEDLILPPGALEDLERLPWIAVRMWMSAGDLAMYRKVRSDTENHEGDDDPRTWDVDKAKPTGGIGRVREMREYFGRTDSGLKKGDIFEILKVFVSFDYDGDGECEELIAIFDRTSGELLWRGWSGLDRRPVVPFVFQVRGHMPHGYGVMEMLKPYQEEVTESHNDRALNVKLANFRVFKSRTGQVDEETLSLWENRNIQLQDPDRDLKEMVLSEAHPSAAQYQAITMGLAERRVGVTELNTPRPSQVLGSRTPAFTTASLLQQQFNRFTPAYDAIRIGAATAIVQCLWRYHERILTEGDDGPAARNVLAVVGEELGPLVVALLRRDDFSESVAVTMTASSATVNRDSDRQNALLLVNMLSAYYQKLVDLSMLAANPQTPPKLRDILVKVAEAGQEVVERAVRTFDQIRDPNRLVVDISEDLRAMEQPGGGASPMEGLISSVMAGMQQNGQPGQAPIAQTPFPVGGEVGTMGPNEVQ